MLILSKWNHTFTVLINSSHRIIIRIIKNEVLKRPHFFIKYVDFNNFYSENCMSSIEKNVILPLHYSLPNKKTSIKG